MHTRVQLSVRCTQSPRPYGQQLPAAPRCRLTTSCLPRTPSPWQSMPGQSMPSGSRAQELDPQLHTPCPPRALVLDGVHMHMRSMCMCTYMSYVQYTSARAQSRQRNPLGPARLSGPVDSAAGGASHMLSVARNRCRGKARRHARSPTAARGGQPLRGGSEGRMARQPGSVPVARRHSPPLRSVLRRDRVLLLRIAVARLTCAHLGVRDRIVAAGPIAAA